MSKLTVCIDSNVYISGIAFGGNPLKVLEMGLNREFFLVTGPNILNEVRRNLLVKLGLGKVRVEQFLYDLGQVSSIYVPEGKNHYVDHEADNLVLELALIGGCDVLVTGDKKHLLPLKTFQGVIIEPPSIFLQRFDGKVIQ